MNVVQKIITLILYNGHFFLVQEEGIMPLKAYIFWFNMPLHCHHDQIMDIFDAETTVGNTSGNHRIASMDTDLSLLLKELSTSFKEIPGRAHFSFPKPRHPLYEKSFDAIKAYIVDRVSF